MYNFHFKNHSSSSNIDFNKIGVSLETLEFICLIFERRLCAERLKDAYFSRKVVLRNCWNDIICASINSIFHYSTRFFMFSDGCISALGRFKKCWMKWATLKYLSVSYQVPYQSMQSCNFSMQLTEYSLVIGGWGKPLEFSPNFRTWLIHLRKGTFSHLQHAALFCKTNSGKLVPDCSACFPYIAVFLSKGPETP